MNKSVLWSSIGFTILGVVNLVLCVILASLGVVEVRSMGYLFAIIQLVVTWLPVILNKYFHVEFDLIFLISFHLFIFCGICIGSQWGVYQMNSWYDKVVHTVGGFILAFLGYTVYANTKNQKLNLFWVFVLVFSFSMMCGGVWEILEYLTDGLFSNNAQNWADFSGNALIGREALADTMLDLICDFVGSIVCGIVAVFLEKKKSKEENLKNSGVIEKKETEK